MNSIDFHSLQVFLAVAKHRSFTIAGEGLGMTQSAVSRRIQDLESSLGVKLVERTTRRVRLTRAGESWLAEATRLINQKDTAVREFQENYGIKNPAIRVGLGDTIPFAHLPGILTARSPARLSIKTGGDELLAEKLLGFEVDLIVVSEIPQLPTDLSILHSYDDPFVLITPPGSNPDQDRKFISFNQATDLGRRMMGWIEANAPGGELVVEVDTFDLAINLVSLGFGSALVPRRALAVYGKRKPVKRFDIEPVFTRNVVVAGRKKGPHSEHVLRFIEGILFSG